MFYKEYITMSLNQEIQSDFSPDYIKKNCVIVIPKVDIIKINALLYGILNKNTLEAPYLIGEYNFFPISAVNKYIDKKINPQVVFVEGESGVGKTHFLEYSILKFIHKNRRVIYLNINTLLDYIKKYYKDAYLFSELDKIDCVVIDDFQLLNTEKLSSFFEGIFNFLNYLMVNNKFLLVASDVSPYSLQIFPERIVTRLKAGILTKIQPPDQDTKKIYIDFFCKENNLPEIDNKIIDYIVENARNFRELKANLTQYQFLYVQTGTVDLEMLKLFIRPKKENFQPTNVKINELKKVLNEYYGYQTELNETGKKKRSRLEVLIDSVIFFLLINYDQNTKEKYSKRQLAKILSFNPSHCSEVYKRGEEEFNSYNAVFRKTLLQIVG